MQLVESISLRPQLAPILEAKELKLLDIKQYWHKSKKSTEVKVAGYSRSAKNFIIKDFLVISVDSKTIANVIDKNWY